MEMTQYSKDRDIVINGFTKHGVWFKPPTPPSSSSKGNSKIQIFLQGLSPHHCCKTWMRCMEPPKGLVNIQKWLTPLSWMISSRSLTIGVICNKCIIPNYSHLSWHGKVCFNIWKSHLWMTIMNSNVPMKFRLKSGGYIGLPIMFLSLQELWPKVV
jgi:hypothetical protein